MDEKPLQKRAKHVAKHVDGAVIAVDVVAASQD